MALRITLWALLLGTLVMGFFGLHVGSATTTLVGALVLAFILFFLYFLAKYLLGFGAIVFKVILIAALIFFLGIALFKGCTIAWNKTTDTAHSFSQSVHDKFNEASQNAGWRDNGSVLGSPSSWWASIKQKWALLGKSAVLSKSKNLPLTDNSSNSNKKIQLNGTVQEIRSGYLFRLNNHFIKLYGIDAPDPSQTCIDRAGEKYPCGKLAKNKLKQLIFNKEIQCSLLATDGAGNYVATCKMDIYDIGAVMVSSGWAVANRISTDVYIPYEQKARQKRSGLWEGKFTAPWLSRRSAK